MESLEYTTKSTGHEKAPYYAIVLLSLKEKMSTPVDKFRSYFLSLLGNKDYEKVLTTLAKVDKALDTSRKESSRRSSPYSRGEVFGRNVTCPVYCGNKGHTRDRCFRFKRSQSYAGSSSNNYWTTRFLLQFNIWLIKQFKAFFIVCSTLIKHIYCFLFVSFVLNPLLVSFLPQSWVSSACRGVLLPFGQVPNGKAITPGLAPFSFFLLGFC